MHIASENDLDNVFIVDHQNSTQTSLIKRQDLNTKVGWLLPETCATPDRRRSPFCGFTAHNNQFTDHQWLTFQAEEIAFGVFILDVGCCLDSCLEQAYLTKLVKYHPIVQKKYLASATNVNNWYLSLAAWATCIGLSLGVSG